MILPATALYGALLTLLTVGLAANVSRNRNRAQVFYGHGEDNPLLRAQRAHGNAAENVPLGILMLLVCESLGAGSVLMHCFGGALLVGRLASAFGLINVVVPARVGGIVLTWGSLAGMSGYALFLHFTG